MVLLVRGGTALYGRKQQSVRFYCFTTSHQRGRNFPAEIRRSRILLGKLVIVETTPNSMIPGTFLGRGEQDEKSAPTFTKGKISAARNGRKIIAKRARIALNRA